MDGLNALYLVGGLVVLYLWNQGRSAGNLIYTPGNVTGISFQGLNPVATVDLIVQNTSNTDFTINSLAGNAYTDTNTLIGNIADFTPVVVRANSQQSVPLTITLFALGLINPIITAFQDHSIQKTIDIKGSVNANGYQVPLSLTYVVGA